ADEVDGVAVGAAEVLPRPGVGADGQHPHQVGGDVDRRREGDGRAVGRAVGQPGRLGGHGRAGGAARRPGGGGGGRRLGRRRRVLHDGRPGEGGGRGRRLADHETPLRPVAGGAGDRGQHGGGDAGGGRPAEGAGNVHGELGDLS